MQKQAPIVISKQRGIDSQLYEHLVDVKQTTKYALRQKFVLSGDGTLRRSIESLKAKKIIAVEGAQVTLIDNNVRIN